MTGRESTVDQPGVNARRTGSGALAAGAAAIALAMAAVVGTALGFEHVGGFIPCALCLEQRTPYYVAVPVMAAAALAARLRAPSWLPRLLIAAGGLLMLYGLGLGVYHAGVEWGWWPGPASCATAAPGLTRDAGSLLDDLNALRPPSCEEAAGRFLGLSFAGWNVIASAALAAACLSLALAGRGNRMRRR